MLRNHLPKSLVAVSLAAVVLSCDWVGGSRDPSVGPQDPLWNTYISRHTAGSISKQDRIRILFVNDIVSEEMVGEDAEDFLDINPSIDASITFAATNEIIVVPEENLQPDRAYRITLKRRDLIGIPDELDRYEFLVRVVKQDFEVEITGLSPSEENNTSMVLSGELVTADIDEAELVEAILSATYMNQNLPIIWEHDADGRHHNFTIEGITRQNENQSVELAWNGDPLDVESEGEQSIEVPALNVFTVTSVAAVQEDRQLILVRFSDSLDTRQNIRGLIQLGGNDNFTTNIQGNTLRISPRERINGDVALIVEPGIRSSQGFRLEQRREETITFAGNKPQVRFVGRGTILPDNPILTVPIEAVNVNSVQVTAFRVYDNNIGQFLQRNQLSGAIEMERVGRYLWRKTIELSSLTANEWNRYSLDVTDLIRENPEGMFRLTLSINRSNSTYTCTEEANEIPAMREPRLANWDDFGGREVSSWDYAETYFGVGDNSSWSDREDPCKDAYYRYNNSSSASRNFLASNIGIVAKQDQRGEVLIATTNIRTAEPMAGVTVTFMNFQDQPIGRVTTDGDGIARYMLNGNPFYAIAEGNGQKGYLKMSAGTALPTSHFDVGGVSVVDGIKGFIYGERGVWRPGDDIHLSFVLEDQENPLPDDHPVTMQLFNPSGQQIERVVNNTPTNGFYTFTLSTDEDAPTGNWVARAELGGRTFAKTLKIETVIPNRLSVQLDFEDAETLNSTEPLDGTLFGQWLSGATASNLNADVQVRLTPTATRFSRFADFRFDDPARSFESEPQTIFDGKLDGNGNAQFSYRLTPSGNPPGMLRAHFTTRVFENSGAFSTNRQTFPFSPYSTYLGVKMPQGDRARGMLLTDTTHTVEIASLSADGEPVSVNGIQVTLYKVGWRWWWDRSGETLAQYASANHRSIVHRGEVNTRNGRGTWEFEIEYPAWGRYLLRACDPSGRHCTGKLFYIDWPGWAGRPQEETGVGANVLTFFSDKQEYTVGETAQIQLPETAEGRALVTVENGTTILEQRWLELSSGRTRFDLPITSQMSPNAYVSVTMVQPHAERNNDRPIRLYGVIPIVVNDPQTRIAPVIVAADEWRPETEVTVEVSEQSGRAMTYTLAVVDEGLLGLTNYETPDLHDHFYQKEALGVKTWDLFDEVVGAYGGELERLLALGGGDEADGPGAQDDERRFPPVVRFLGPFTLRARGENTHTVDIPEYIGAVRVMVVAGHEGAYGSASKSVFVREPLSMLATLPRVIGPGEELMVPVSLFAMEEGIRRATLSVEVDEHFEVVGSGSTTVEFSGPQERMAFLRINVGQRLGVGRLRFIASSPQHTTESNIAIEVRSPNPETIEQVRERIAPGESWSANVVPHGLPGTNEVSMEITTLPPLNLERRLRYLVRYPHGCVEQITSAVFPQLYLPSLVSLEPVKSDEVQRNVQAGIDRLRGFQVQAGSFVYWPGGFIGASFNARNSWVTNYVGHFLVEAEKLGFHVPSGMLNNWANFQRRAAQGWRRRGDVSTLDQAYRLYTLSLAERPELGAMNRLRESGELETPERWLLAAAYQLAGLPDVAEELVRNATHEVKSYSQPGWSLGSTLRDRAIILTALAAMERFDEAERLAEQISNQLYSDSWYSTHSLAFSLLGMTKYYGVGNASSGFEFERTLGRGRSEAIESEEPIYTGTLENFPEQGQDIQVNNTSERPLFASVVVRGVARAGEEVESSTGLRVNVRYTDDKGGRLDVSQLRQGTDFEAHVTVTNSSRLDLHDIALEHMVPSGWEIHNPRMDTDGQGRLPNIDYQDIRDDRVYTYFSLRAGETETFSMLLNAAYLGRYYLPGVVAEAMYDETKQGRTAGQWVEVTSRNR